MLNFCVFISHLVLVILIYLHSIGPAHARQQSVEYSQSADVTGGKAVCESGIQSYDFCILIVPTIHVSLYYLSMFLIH